MLFTILNPQTRNLLAALEPDQLQDSESGPGRITVSRIEALGAIAKIRSGPVEVDAAAVVERPGVLFLPTVLLRQVLHSFVGRTMPMRIELTKDGISLDGVSALRYGHTDQKVWAHQIRFFDDPTKAPGMPPSDFQPKWPE